MGRSSEQRFRFGSPLWLQASMFALTLGTGGFCAYAALAGLGMTSGGVELSQVAPPVVWGVGAAASLLISVLLAWVLALPVVFDRTLVISEDSLSVPGLAHSPWPEVIPRREIRRVERVDVSGRPQLRVHHRGGHLDIAVFALEEEAYEAVLDLDPGPRRRPRG